MNLNLKNKGNVLMDIVSLSRIFSLVVNVIIPVIHVQSVYLMMFVISTDICINIKYLPSISR